MGASGGVFANVMRELKPINERLIYHGHCIALAMGLFLDVLTICGSYMRYLTKGEGERLENIYIGVASSLRLM